jgi:tetratricopeptide (TPR) repeat protein
VAHAAADRAGSREDQARARTAAQDKANTAGKSAPASRPAENTGAVNQALQELYRIPRSAAGPRQFGQTDRNNGSSRSQARTEEAAPRRFGFTGRGEAPRPAITENMGRQHDNAIRNSVSELPIGDPNRRPPVGEHITQTPPSGPAVPREDSVTAYNWGPYTDDRYETPPDTLDDRDAGQDLEPNRFGFVRGQQQNQQPGWAGRASARGQSLLSSSSSYMGRGLAAFRAGQYRTAAKHFKMAHENNQGDPSAMIYSAHAFFAIGRYQDAANFLRKAFALEPRIALLNYDMRDDYGNKADFEQQMRALNNAIASAPRDIDRLTFLGYALLYSDQPDRAFEVLTRARSFAPKDKLVALLYDSTLPPDPATPAGSARQGER